ncbi:MULTISPECIES: D-alanyl-D-alanine carboxypeptidase family protein [unclassified Streptomyces]|uniref:D-alanyl-D-alanine carboxypeptidase family protein n=1 Tax=unclassified Streptomyces TaxID=2593676 RepID=UPI002FC3CFDB
MQEPEAGAVGAEASGGTPEAEAPAVDTPTTMFRAPAAAAAGPEAEGAGETDGTDETLEPGSGPDVDSAAEEPAEAEDDAGPASDVTEDAQDAEEDAETGGEAEGAPATAGGDATDEDAGEAEESRDARDEATSEAASEAASDDEAVHGVADDDEADDATDAAGDAAADAPAPAAPAKTEPSAEAIPEKPETEPGKPAPEPAVGAGSGGDPATTALRAARPESAPTAAPPAPPNGGERAPERTSRFVPLPSDAASSSPAAEDVPEPERTRQQPLPPTGERPIELLAALTNKPAPPPTPLRILVRRVKIWTPLVALLAVVFVAAQLLRPPPEPSLELTAAGSYAFDGATPELAWPEAGQAAVDVQGIGSFGTHGEQKPVPIASVAKTMTAYLLLRAHPMEPGEDGASIPVDAKAEKEAGYSEQGESTVRVADGETITQREALDAIMIASANNVARLVARWDAGSEAAFVERMNTAAEELGMTNTTYTDPSGLRDDTVSTAEDQVKLGRAVMEFEVFRDIVDKPAYTDRNGTEHDNWNRLVPLYGTVGIKTGTTTAAGGNLLFAATADVGGTRQLIIGAVLGQHQPPIIDSVLAAGKDLIQSTQKVLTARTIVEKGTVVGVVDDGLGGRTDLVATEDVVAVGWPGQSVELKLSAGEEPVPGEADAGTEVGRLTVGEGPGRVSVPVALAEPLGEPGAAAKITRVL